MKRPTRWRGCVEPWRQDDDELCRRCGQPSAGALAFVSAPPLANRNSRWPFCAAHAQASLAIVPELAPRWWASVN